MKLETGTRVDILVENPASLGEANMSFVLRLLRGEAPGEQYLLSEPGPVLVGRAPDCTIQLRDQRVSRQHCRLSFQQGHWSIEDLQSRSGTIVNGRNVHRADLRDGDTILLGDTRLQLRMHTEAAAQARAAPEAGTAAGNAAGAAGDPDSAGAQGVAGKSEGGGGSAGSPQLVGRRYEMGPLLHHGSTGDFYRARDIETGQTVCLKLLAGSVAAADAELQRFVRGVRTAAKLQHPNIVQLYRAGKSGSHWWLAMEYADGPSVRQLVERYGVGNMLAPARVVAIARDVVAALEAAYERQVLHRNIKPDNILLTKAGVAKLSNFSLARGVVLTTLQRITGTGELVGDLAYMAPERTDPGGEVDCRSDIYALGGCLYLLLTGRPPFTGRGPVELIEHVRNDLPEPPTRYHLAVPRPLEALVLKCLAKSPAERYQTPMQLRAELVSVEKFLAP